MAVVRTCAWLLSLVAAHFSLSAVAGAVEHPSSFATTKQWVTQSGPVDIVVFSVAVLALVTVWYLLAVTVLSLVGAAVRWRPIHIASRLLTVPALRRTLAGIAGSTMAATVSAPLAQASATAPPILVHLGPVDSPVSTTSTTTAPPTPTPTAAPVPPPTSVNARLWTVSSGENLWVIAESHLTDQLGRAPGETELLRYWGRLQQANGELSDPDVIRPGHVLRLPDTA